MTALQAKSPNDDPHYEDENHSIEATAAKDFIKEISAHISNFEHSNQLVGTHVLLHHIHLQLSHFAKYRKILDPDPANQIACVAKKITLNSIIKTGLYRFDPKILEQSISELNQLRTQKAYSYSLEPTLNLASHSESPTRPEKNLDLDFPWNENEAREGQDYLTIQQISSNISDSYQDSFPTPTPFPTGPKPLRETLSSFSKEETKKILQAARQSLYLSLYKSILPPEYTNNPIGRALFINQIHRGKLLIHRNKSGSISFEATRSKINISQKIIEIITGDPNQWQKNFGKLDFQDRPYIELFIKSISVFEQEDLAILQHQRPCLSHLKPEHQEHALNFLYNLAFKYSHPEQLKSQPPKELRKNAILDHHLSTKIIQTALEIITGSVYSPEWLQYHQFKTPSLQSENNRLFLDWVYEHIRQRIFNDLS